MDINLIQGIKSLLLPPAGPLLLLLLLLAGVLRARLVETRRVLILLALVVVTATLAVSTPVAARLLAGSLEARFPALPPTGPLPSGPEAIVVLGTGLYPDAPEYGGDSPTGALLVRLRYAAQLARRSGLPLCAAGGRPFGTGASEASVMRAVLEGEFGVPVRWLDETSRNTAENARETARILEPLGIRQVFVVTHALHMPRTIESFRRVGLEPVAAPTRFITRPSGRPLLLDAFPTHNALSVSAQALHEYLGMAWYALRYPQG